MITLELPWAPKELWPNSYRPHWKAKANATASCRHMAKILALEALHGRKWGSDGARLHWVFHPKTKRVPDKTNCIISTKAWEDGIADAIEVNDRLFDATYAIAEPIKGGLVRVTITEA